MTETKDNVLEMVTTKESIEQHRADEMLDNIAAEYEFIEDLAVRNYSVVAEQSWDSSGTLFDPETKAFIGAHNLKGLFYNEDWVYIVVDLIAKKIANQWLRVMKIRMMDGEEIYEPAENHPLQDIINNPNKWESYFSWMYKLCVDTILMGNSIQWAGSDFIIGIPAQNVTIDFDPKSGDLRSYMAYAYTHADGGIILKNKGVRFDPSEIAHMKMPNPDSLYWGLSAFIPGRRSILFNRYSKEYLNNFYIKGATPQMALEMESQANEKVMLRLLKSFENAYTGRRNQRRTMLVPKGVKIKEITHNLADQELIEHVNNNRETLLAMLKVPKHEVGIQTAGSLGSEEHKTALKNFWASTLKPIMGIITGELERQWKAKLGDQYALQFDLSNVDILQEDLHEKAKLSKELEGIWTPNEIRTELWKKPAVEGGDSLGLGNTDPARLPEPVALAAQSPSPKNSSNESEFNTRSSFTEPRIIDAIVKRNPTWFEERETMINREFQKSGEDLSDLAVDVLADSFGRMIQVFEESSREKSLAIKAADIPSKAVLRSRLRKAMEEFEEIWLGENVKVLTSTVEVGYDSQIGIPFNLPSQVEIETIRAENTEGRRELLEARALSTFANMTDTSTNRVMDIILQGVSESKTIGEISRNITEMVQNVVPSRASMIARTETLTAVSIGQAAAMEDTAELLKDPETGKADLKKVWITAGDDRVRDSHDSMHAQVRAYNEPFITGDGIELQYPRAPGAPAGEVIQCRCSFFVVPTDDLDKITGGNLQADQVD